MTMQVQIRHMDGGDVSLDDCARFSGLIDKAVEDSQLIDQAYVLEISSPGISDQLCSDRDFQTFKGFPVEVIFKDSKTHENRRTGRLHERSPDHLCLNNKGRMDHIPREDVIQVRLTSPTG